MEGAERKVFTDVAKGVHVAVAVLAPVLELDAELDTAVGCFEKISLIEARRC